MAEVVVICTLTVDDVHRAWQRWLGDPTAEVPDRLLATLAGSKSFVSAAMADAGLEMMRVLLLEHAVEGLQVEDPAPTDPPDHDG